MWIKSPRHGTTELAKAYLDYLYSDEGQRLAAKHFYRPATLSDLPAELQQKFPKIELFTVDRVFGGWAEAQAKHFADGGAFDRIYQPSSAQ